MIMFILIPLVLLIAGCADKIEIHDIRLRDRIIACSGGFSEGAQVNLRGTFDEFALKGKANLGFNEAAQSIIFKELSEFPPKNRLRVYEDYIRCIVTPWKH